MSVSGLKGVVAAGLVTLTLTMLPLSRRPTGQQTSARKRDRLHHKQAARKAGGQHAKPRPCGMIPNQAD